MFLLCEEPWIYLKKKEPWIKVFFFQGMDQGFDPCFVQGMVHVKNTVMTTQGFYL
jgi:hypothetical protein